MPWLHLPLDEYTMPVWYPNHCFREASAGRPLDYRTYMDIVASTILFNSTQWQNWKNHKPVANRHIAVTSHDPLTGTTLWSWAQRTVLDCQFGPQMIIDSCANHRVPATSPQNVHAWFVIVWTLGGRPAVTLRQWHNDHAVTLQHVNNYIGYHQLFVSFQYLPSDDISNTTTQSDSIANGIKTEQEDETGAHCSTGCFWTATRQTGTQGATVWFKLWLLRRVTLGHYDTLIQELMREWRGDFKAFLKSSHPCSVRWLREWPQESQSTRTICLVCLLVWGLQ